MTVPEADDDLRGGAGTHTVTLALVDSFPPEVPAGTELTARVRASCAHGCDLRGARMSVVSEGTCLAEGTLHGSGEGDALEASLTWKVPPRVGDWTGAVVLRGRAPHEETSLDLRCRLLPHATSLAVWSAASPPRGSTWRVSVGVKCASGCSLAGQPVEILDERGAKWGEGELEATPRPGTSSLYAADVTVAAPDRAGVFSRTARFAGATLEAPHESATASFTFRCVDPPEHTVTVRIAFEGIDPHKHGIEVRIGPYSAFTDEDGAARVGVSKGVHQVSTWRADLEPVSTRIDVASDASIDLVTGPRRVVDEDAERAWM